ncbi:MAG: 4-hydroxybenzoyl-CoA thioesterase, partial [Candidatus Omnitrophica bacterium]|nr:4-hydroxybenzoyl-CoA thioesterase [Candidatus Omnitrophota bacterium]
MKKRIYYHDTDCEGVVYYANYLKYFEEARTEHLDGCGVTLRTLHDSRILFAVKETSVRYYAPARY